MTVRLSLSCIILFWASLLPPQPSHADGWSDEFGVPGSDESVSVLCEFEGDLIAGGRIYQMDHVLAGGVVRWDGVQWHSMGSSRRADVHDLHVHAGVLYAAGRMDFEGTSRTGVFRWDRTHWTLISDPALMGETRCLETYGGDLYAGGGGSTTDPAMLFGIARWDGSSWQSVGSGVTFDPDSGYQEVDSLVLFEGRLIAAGGFNMIGGVTARRVAAWDGSGWEAFGDGFSSTTPSIDWYVRVRTALVISGTLYVQGDLNDFPLPGEFESIAQWTGTEWVPVGNAAALDLSEGMVNFPGDRLVAARSLGDPFDTQLMEWNGIEWIHFADAFGARSSSPHHRIIRDANFYDGRPIIVGAFGGVEDAVTSGIAALGSEGWESIDPVAASGQGIRSETISTLATYLGQPTTTGRKPVPGEGLGPPNVLHWVDGRWVRLGELAPQNRWDARMVQWRRNLVIASSRGYIAGQEFGRLAKWNGDRWSSIDVEGANFSGGEFGELLSYKGNLVVTGSFRYENSFEGFMLYDGDTWSSDRVDAPGDPYGQTFSAAAIVWDDKLVMSGRVHLDDGGNLEGIVTWDGTSWAELPWPYGGLARCFAVAWGDLFATGSFRDETTGEEGGLVQWDGTEWSLLEDHPFAYGADLIFEHSGNLFATGHTADSTQPLYYFDSVNWHPFGDFHPYIGEQPHSAVSIGDSFWLAGSMTRVDDRSSYAIARYDGRFPQLVALLDLHVGSGGAPVFGATGIVPVKLKNWRPRNSGVGSFGRVSLTLTWDERDLEFESAQFDQRFKDWSISKHVEPGRMEIDMVGVNPERLDLGNVPVMNCRFRRIGIRYEAPVEVESARVFSAGGKEIGVLIDRGAVWNDCDKGDVVDDDVIDLDDVMSAILYMTGSYLNVMQQCAADVDYDGSVDIGDAVVLMREIHGLGTILRKEATTVEILPRSGGSTEVHITAAAARFEASVPDGIEIGATSPSGLVAVSGPNGDGRYEVIAVDSEGPLTIHIRSQSADMGHVIIDKLRVATIDGAVSEVPGEWFSILTNTAPAVRTMFHGVSPTPFNARTFLKFSLAEASPVRLQVFDTAGRLVTTLTDEILPAGNHELMWNGTDSRGNEVGSGVYLVRTELDGRVETASAVLVK